MHILAGYAVENRIIVGIVMRQHVLAVQSMASVVVTVNAFLKTRIIGNGRRLSLQSIICWIS